MNEYPEEGGPCTQQNCTGYFFFPPVENCSCHIAPPCGRCVDNPLTCNTCWYAVEKEHETLTEQLAQKTYETWHVPRHKTTHSFPNGRVFNYGYDSRSGSTMEYKGDYEGEVTVKEIIDWLGDGTFGHRGPFFGPKTWSYTKITD